MATSCARRAGSLALEFVQLRRRLVRWAVRIGLAILAVLVVATVVGLSVESTRWRLYLIGRKLRGDVREVSWGELLRMIGPNSRYYLRPIISEGRSLNGA